MTDDNSPIDCCFEDEDALYLSYMPFIKGGGLFIRTTEPYKLDDELSLSVLLLDEAEPYLAEGKIVWLTPKGAQGNKPIGMGVQLIGQSGRVLNNKIETYLAGMLKSVHQTDTI